MRDFQNALLDPLLWQGTTQLVEGASYTRALAVLDEFLTTHGERLISDPVRRAMLQRDLWAVFDWLTFRPSGDLAARAQLEQRLAQAIQRLALSRPQIDALPNSYEHALASGEFATTQQPANPQAAFLPSGLLTPGSDWINLGRQGGPLAMTHLQGLPFLGRSAFLVFVSVPGGRTAGLAFVAALQTQAIPPHVVRGSSVALVRRMLLIDDQGQLAASPLIESVQLRFFDATGAQVPFEAALDRDRLFAGEAGGLRPLTPNDRDFQLFVSRGDVLTAPDIPDDDLRPRVLATCAGCHENDPGLAGATSILSYSRIRFPLPGGQPPVLTITTPDDEMRATIAWKQAQDSWQQLLALWHS